MRKWISTQKFKNLGVVGDFREKPWAKVDTNNDAETVYFSKKHIIIYGVQISVKTYVDMAFGSKEFRNVCTASGVIFSSVLLFMHAATKLVKRWIQTVGGLVLPTLEDGHISQENVQAALSVLRFTTHATKERTTFEVPWVRNRGRYLRVVLMWNWQ